MSDKYAYNGVGFLGLLTLLFIGLKLAEFINWSWWLVLSPILIPTGVIVLIIAVIVIIAVIGSIKK